MTFPFEMYQSMLWTFPLVLARVAIVLRLTPFLGGGPMPPLAWLSLSGAVGIAIVSALAPIPGPQPDPWFWSILLIKELLIGALIGVFVRLSFSVLEVVGSLVGLSTLPFPSASGDHSQTGSPIIQFVWLLGAVLFLGVGGHHGLLDGLMSTFHCAPPNQLSTSGIWPDGSSKIVGLFASMMGTAVLLAAPLYLAGLLADFIGAVVALFLPWTGALASGQLLRGVIVQLVFLAALGWVISGAIEFIGESLRGLRVCNPSFP